jgi:hypothetical protein
MQEENKTLQLKHLQTNSDAIETKPLKSEGRTKANQVPNKGSSPETRYVNSHFDKLAGSLRQNLLRRKQATIQDK